MKTAPWRNVRLTSSQRPGNHSMKILSRRNHLGVIWLGVQIALDSWLDTAARWGCLGVPQSKFEARRYPQTNSELSDGQQVPMKQSCFADENGTTVDRAPFTIACIP